MCWYVLSPAGYLLYIFSSRCESVPSEKTLSMYKSENLICFFFCTYISSRCESWIQTPRSRKKNLKHEWTYVNFYSHILWKSNDTKFLFIAVNISWQKKNVSSPCVYSELVNNRCLINIATGETSQVITSRHFSSLLFTSMSILTPLALINWKANTMHISDNSTYPFIFLHFSGSARFCNQCSLLLLLGVFWINNRFIFLRDLFSACKPFSTFTSNRCFCKISNEIQSVFFVIFWCYTNGKKLGFRGVWGFK